MSYPATPESQDYMLESHQFVNQGYIMPEWSTLDRYIEWQRDQAAYTSSEPLVTDYNQYQSQSQSKLDSFSTWQPQQTTGMPMPHNQLWAPMSAMPAFTTPPQSVAMLDGYESHNDDAANDSASASGFSTPNARDPGPQMPKIGRPRNTPSSTTDGESTSNSGGKAPGQARRRNQNREAQRAFRARQRQYIEQLATENKELVTKNAELEERYDVLAKAYQKVVVGIGRSNGSGPAPDLDRRRAGSSRPDGSKPGQYGRS